MHEPRYVSISEPAYGIGAAAAPRAAAAAPAAAKLRPRPGARMFDEYAQQPYVLSPGRHSMNDPVMVSISDPVYYAADK
jgi:hypothetical protein